MVDEDLVRKKLAFIETCVRELRTLAKPDQIKHDVREERFVAHTLQLAIQATLDTASHIVSDRRLGEPRTHRELFDLLARDGWLSAGLTETLRDMAGFRNVVVHGYDKLDLGVLREIVECRLDDLLAFVVTIRRALGDE